MILYESGEIINEDNVHLCPMCGDAFFKRINMKNHHAQKHGVSIAGEVAPCETCGESIVANPTRISSRDNLFCNEECYGEWLSENVSGEDSWNWRGGKEYVECSWCGETIYRETCHLKRSDKLFCDTECHGNWKSENQIGEDNPVWLGGNNGFYGPNWREQRGKALQRDDKQCKVCGISDSEHKDRHGHGLHVHHIKRKEDFRNDGELDYESANKLSNLTTLCNNHHRKAESGKIDNSMVRIEQ